VCRLRSPKFVITPTALTEKRMAAADSDCYPFSRQANARPDIGPYRVFPSRRTLWLPTDALLHLIWIRAGHKPLLMFLTIIAIRAVAGRGATDGL